MTRNVGSLGLAGLSVSEGGPSPTSRTPPPPGFGVGVGAFGSDGEAKSASFDDLAMALGTGLAESMDDSTSDAPPSRLDAAASVRRRRTPAPSDVDNYTRQSRHLASRLVGGGGGGGGGPVAGFDYLNPSGTGHLLIPPSNSAFLDRLKGAERDGGAAGVGVEGSWRDGDGGREAAMAPGGNSFATSQRSGGQPQRQQQQQRPAVFTAAMMGRARSNNISGGLDFLQIQSGGSSNSAEKIDGRSGPDDDHRTLTQELLRHQMWQQSNPTDGYRANGKPIGVTVVEPSSLRNSPAPRPPGASGDGLMYPMRSNVVLSGFVGGGGAALGPSNLGGDGQGYQSIGNGGNGREHPNFALGNAVDFSGGGASAPFANAGGRASAPPTNIPQGGVIGVGLGGANAAALRAYQASSLQMRVAELHQELGAGGGSAGARVPSGVPINLRTLPAGNVIVLASPPPPSAQMKMAPSREATPMDRNASRPPLPSNSVASPAPNSASRASPEQKERERAAIEELAPYIRDPPRNQKGSSGPSSNATSRGVAVLFASSLHVPDVRSTCEAFGALESFRSDFAETKGVYFVTFYDLRSARLAVAELPKALNSMVSMADGDKIEVKYCVSLNSSSATDESMLLLSNLPGTVDEQDLSQSMSSFGEIRAVHYQANMFDEDSDRATYLVEFYDIQDARQALLELEQTHPWGEGVTIKVGSRNPTKRKQGRDLLLLMSTWRQGQKAEGGNNVVSPSLSPKPPPAQESRSSRTVHTENQHNTAAMNAHSAASVHQSYQFNAHQDFQQQYSTQVVVGPDGNYMYVLVPNQPQVAAPQAYGFPGQMIIDPHQQHQYMYANQQYAQNPQIIDQQFRMQYNNGMAASSYGVHVQESHAPPTQFVRLPAEINSWNSGSLSSGSQSPHIQGHRVQKRVSGGKSTASNGSGSSSNNPVDDENASLSLNIDCVKSGRDRRSSLMVRNIPNKYTQKMLLAEFAEAGHGSDKMDFFYLPIDFKNKCNRGYAFVNFVDYKDIIPFFDAYNGTSWSSFNSDKICDITYARIQGKAAMLKRFENSALMEKDDEYRPMVFVSHGERKGQLEAMPGTNMR